MTTHTFDKERYATFYPRCLVQFFERPARTRQKDYREPKLVMSKRFASWRAAKKAKREWETTTQEGK